MKAPLKSGRYLLDGEGVLHPFRRRYRVKAVAIVTVRLRSEAERRARLVIAEAGDLPQAIVARLSKAAQRELASQPKPCPASVASIAPRRAKIDISHAPSSMESLVEGWRK